MVLLHLLALLVGAPSPGGSLPQEGEPVCVVAHTSPDMEEVGRDYVRRVFLLNQRFWPDGTPAHPVNLPASSPVREHFSLATFGQTVREMAPYWNDRYFHGTRPPPTLASEEAVILFLTRTPGSVGYLPDYLLPDVPPALQILLCEK